MKNLLRKILPNSWILASHKIRAVVACLLYNFPARNIRVIGVTGTNGKTTTCHLITSILQEAGFKVAMATTIDFQIGEKREVNKAKMTTLSPFALQRFIYRAVKEKCTYCVIETTSHAVIQNRIWGIPYDVMVFTNLTHEHLDYHHSFSEYKKVKGQLFANLEKSLRKPNTLKASIVNRDDPNFSYFSEFDADVKLSYGIMGGDVSAQNIFYKPDGTDFIVTTPKGKMLVQLKLPGRFNIHNALAAAATALSCGIDIKTIKNGLEKIKGVAGRMEKIESGQNFTVLIDYAHTPDAMQKIYETLIPIKKGNLIHVFGACGDRDKTKRPIMGALAGRYADYIILTNEDPYTENPQKIIGEIARGVPRGRAKNKEGKKEGVNFWKIFDRREAIQKAIELAKKNDIVLITGKGAEQAIVVGAKHIPWDDREVTRQLLRQTR
ncbi:MAG: UDP-N-acetylmuramoyl-L-alanyl-D-glutamate--2,6-diaminopimelate ligase [Candidatus Berkelbacteria bacterium]|nr:UDP-N-acetylmuramoyl-L-alanyl-D-glutamate--2,6-diaminopimelate ligase [Candidatus Berkelbacteria bacterium]